MNYHLQNHPEREINDPEEIADLLKKGKYLTIALCHDNEPYLESHSFIKRFYKAFTRFLASFAL